MSSRRDQEYAVHSYAQIVRRTSANAGGIAPVAFVPAEPDAVVFRATSCAYLDRQARSDQALIEGPPHAVHCRRILERCAGLCHQVWEAKFSGGQSAFALVAGPAGDGEIRDPVAAAPVDGDQMLLLQPHSVPRWYSTPTISGFWSAWVSNRTNSMLIAVMGQTARSRRIHVSVVRTRWASDGASQPAGRLRLRKRTGR